MKVFISWSGEYTQGVANELGNWIPSVLQNIETFVSSQDISAGERWQSKINASLLDMDFGILLLTKENFQRPWIMFEAGALAKNLDISRVVPIFCDGEELDLSKTPLFQFNHVKLDMQGVLGLLTSMYEFSTDILVKEDAFKRAFDIWWPTLEKALAELNDSEPLVKTHPVLSVETRLEHIEHGLTDLLGVVRTLASRKDEPSVKTVVEALFDRGIVSPSAALGLVPPVAPTRGRGLLHFMNSEAGRKVLESIELAENAKHAPLANEDSDDKPK